jgi:hypothetical protein
MKRQLRLEKAGYKIIWIMNDYDYKVIARKGNQFYKGTSISNLYKQIFG